MHRNLVYGLSISIFLGLASVASAQTTTITPPITGTANQSRQSEMASLRQAHRLLAEADHDYDGHRAKAAEEVHKAIMDLREAHHAKSDQSGPGHEGTARTGSGHVERSAHAVVGGTNQTGKVREPQATSDSQLRQALSLLQGVQPELTSQHPNAATNVAAAITEINTALGIK